MRNTNQRRHRWFVKRELVLKGEGHSHGRTLTLTPQVQIAGLALLVTTACAGAFGLVSLASERSETQAMQAALLDREAQVADEQRRVAAFHDELEAASERLEKRQSFIERVVEMLPQAGIEAEPAAATHSQGDARLERLGAIVPEARGLARVERRQLAAVAMLTGYAESRTKRAEQAIRRLGLDPRRVRDATRGAVEDGMGGPLEMMSTEADGSLDPRFERLGTSLARMAALDQGISRIPQVMPADVVRMTSNFGYRRDPFNGAAAMHAGIDFGGRMGDPIRAAADGTVSFVGLRSGYGKMVEVSHGNGLTTRYAHMSAWKAKVGEVVKAGAVIGAIGSTGRSTGPHLHFEVRVGDRAVNPRPFLERAPGIVEEMREP